MKKHNAEQELELAKKKLEAQKLEVEKLSKKLEEEKKKNDPCVKIKNYASVLEILNHDDKKDVVKIDGFDKEEIEWFKNIIKKVRINKAYNQGWLPKKGENRWYNWYDISSGFAFYYSSSDVTTAYTASASRLCLRERKYAEDFAKKFKPIDESIILK